MSERSRPWWAIGCSSEMTARDVRNARSMNISVIGFMLSVVAAKFAMSRFPLGAATTAFVLLVPLVVGAVYFRAVATFVREADELTRSIHVQAMAVAAGAALGAWVFETLWADAAVLLGDPGWAGLVADVANPIMGLALGYSIAVVRLHRRYGG